ncbi:MAG: uncharacterized protein JWN94_806 [Betaproteobacteria bacterium]|nr:uncharacterized protein [Betaproteobacteria bacterium]
MKTSVRSSLLFVAAIVTLCVNTAFAATTWTDWTTAAVGSPGSAAGTLNGIGVSYSGQVINSVLNGTSNVWSPDSSFIGGSSTTSPSVVGDDIRLNGAFTGIQTVTFAAPLVNPLFAIWSLGDPTTMASFTFNATPTLQAGGLNSQYGGQPITVAGNVVSGMEGNGVVQFMGTFSSISWTNTFENFYAFQVGVNAVPEPESYAMLLAGLGLLGFTARRRQRNAA